MKSKDRIYIYVGIIVGVILITSSLALILRGPSFDGVLPFGGPIIAISIAALTTSLWSAIHAETYDELKAKYQVLESSHKHQVDELKSMMDIQNQKLKDAEERADAAERRAKKAEQDNKGSLLLTIAAMLNLIASQPRKLNQSGVISEILSQYPSRRGLSKRNLEENFSAANSAAEQATKEGS